MASGTGMILVGDTHVRVEDIVQYEAHTVNGLGVGTDIVYKSPTEELPYRLIKVCAIGDSLDEIEKKIEVAING